MFYICLQVVRIKVASPKNDVEMHGVCHKGLEDPLAGALSRLSETGRILLDRAPNPTNDLKLFLIRRFRDVSTIVLRQSARTEIWNVRPRIAPCPMVVVGLGRI
jgi:hypothetical protein